jgi:hypothetical protein
MNEEALQQCTLRTSEALIEEDKSRVHRKKPLSKLHDTESKTSKAMFFFSFFFLAFAA